MNYIKDNGMMEKLPFWKFGGKSSSAEKYLFENENGSGQILLYNVLPGLKLAVTELNGSTMNFYHPAVSGVMQVNYCLNGRMGWVMQGGRSIYLGQGDVSFHMMDCCTVSGITLPLGHYSGIALFVDLNMAAQPFAETLNLSEVNLPAWAEKFCRGGEVTVWPGTAEIADMFALLPRVKSEYRQAYFKLKAQEILLFLAVYGVPHLKTAESCEERYMEIIKKIHAKITGSWQEHYTIEQLAREYSINASVLKKVFKMVYGKPVAQYMKEYRMRKAAALLVAGSSSVAEIAAAAGYGSQSKFAAAFKQVMQLAPSEYRMRYSKK